MTSLLFAYPTWVLQANSLTDQVNLIRDLSLRRYGISEMGLFRRARFDHVDPRSQQLDLGTMSDHSERPGVPMFSPSRCATRARAAQH